MTATTSDIEIVVIGAGAVGLAIARALALRGHEVLVLERHAKAGTETSSRSSEVIHAGLYYPPGSLKARLCVEGRQLLYAFARDNGIAHRRLGKLLVATRETELAALDAIAARAASNGVSDLERLDAQAAKAREPELACIAAYLSPSTGVIDSHAFILALEGHVTANGGTIALASEATGLTHLGDRFALTIESAGRSSKLIARRVVNAAGLGASAIGGTLRGTRPGYRAPETYPARGHYYTLSGKAPFSHLVYPMPAGNWLGIHLTIDVGGQAKFGPDLEWSATPSLAFDDRDGSRRARFEAEIRRYWPGLPENVLEPGYVGIRPKIYREGEQAPDFAIHGQAEHGIAGFIALYGIESPGLTSSLAIGDLVADLVARQT